MPCTLWFQLYAAIESQTSQTVKGQRLLMTSKQTQRIFKQAKL